MDKKQPEKILYEVSPSQWVFAGGYALCILGSVLVVPLFVMFYNYLRLKTTKYIISTQRIRIRYGIINKITDEIELYRILDYKLREPLALRMFGLAHIELTTMDQTDPIVILTGIKNAQKILDDIRTNAEISRSTSRVSEMDVSGLR